MKRPTWFDWQTVGAIEASHRNAQRVGRTNAMFSTSRLNAS
jgi:hypothetical protein